MAKTHQAQGHRYLCRRGAETLSVAALLLLLAACGGPASPPGQVPEDTRLSLYAVNYPLAYFAERIGGDEVRVTLPVPAGIDPGRWQPEPADIEAFQAADLVLLNGAGYAAWVKAAALPNNRLVDTSRGFRDQVIRLPRDQGPASGATASYTWLDPLLAVEQARAILDALLTYRPEQETAFRSHFTLLERDLNSLDEALAAAFGRLDDQSVLFAQPIYQYLQRRFLPGSRSLNLLPDAVPVPASLADLRVLLAESPATILIWPREPYAVTVEMLEADGLRSVAFVPGANRPAEGDYLDLMRWNLGNLARVMPAEPELEATGDGS